MNPDYAGTAPTIEVAPNRYFTAYMLTYTDGSVKGFYWHLEDSSGQMLSLPSVKK